MPRKEHNQIIISTSETAEPYIEKLPISGLVDFVVEMRSEGQASLLKTWKVKSGETTAAPTSMGKPAGNFAARD